MSWLSGHFKLEKRVSELERVVAASNKEFHELYDATADLQERCHKQMKRTILERARIERQDTEAATAVPEMPLGGNGRLPHGGMLTENQKQIQQQILRRRGGL